MEGKQYLEKGTRRVETVGVEMLRLRCPLGRYNCDLYPLRGVAGATKMHKFAFLKGNAKAFSLNAIVDVRRGRRRRHEMSIFFWIVRKPQVLTTCKFFTTLPSVADTFRPEMTSSSTSGWQQSAQKCSFWVMFGSRLLDNDSIDFKKA